MNSPTIEPRRDLTLPHAVSLVVGIIIGTGVFLKSATMSQSLGTPGLVLAAWVAAGLVAMLGALCFAELGAMLPKAGGEYAYLRTAYGDLAGFLFACNSVVIGSATIAAYGAAFAIFASDLHSFGGAWLERPVHFLGHDYALQLGPRQLLAVAVIFVFAAVNCAGAAIGGWAQTALTAAKVLATLAIGIGIFVLGGASGGGWWNLAPPAAAMPGGWSAFGAAMLAALWAYSGWQYVSMAAAEVERPERNLPRAIIGGSLLVLAIYAVVNVAYFYGLPFEQVATANSDAYPRAPSVAARAVETFLGSKAAAVAACVFLLSTVGALNGVLLGRARVPYAAARDGLFFKSFGHLHPVSGAPVRSIVFMSVFAVVLVVSGTFDQLTDMAILAYAIFWIPVVLAVVVLRRKLPDAPRPYRVPLSPVTPALFALVMLWIVINSFRTSPLEAITTVTLILLALPLYPLFRKRAGAPGRI